MASNKTRKPTTANPPRKKAKRKKGFIAAVFVISVIVFTIGLAYLGFQKKPPPFVIENSAKKEVSIIPPPRTQKKPDIDTRPRISIIIDDLGYSAKIDEEILNIDAPLTLAVFPLMKDSRRIAGEAALRGREIIMHLPMEPYNYPQENSGEGSLLTTMDDIAIITQLYENINSIPEIKGVNNHMGSRFTEDRERMRIVLKQLKDRGLFFIDSRTSPASVATKVAREVKIRSATRDVFLDNDQSEASIREQLEELKSIARKTGSAIGIGHPYPATIATLNDTIKDIENEFKIVPVSELVE